MSSAPRPRLGVVSSCPACGKELPGEFPFCPFCAAPLGDPDREQRKIVTVVFCDVTGSTALGERLDPEALRRVMTRYFEAMTRAIEAHEGTVEKFIGDAVMAVFGVPAAHEDDALRVPRGIGDAKCAPRAWRRRSDRCQHWRGRDGNRGATSDG